MPSWIERLLGAGRPEKSHMSGGAGPAVADPVGPAGDDDRDRRIAADLDRYLAARQEHRLFITDYPYALTSRAFDKSVGGGKILDLLARSASESAAWLERVRGHAPQFREIAGAFSGNGAEPFWDNGMIPPLDGMILYAMVRKLRPRTYLEVGSGNSTKFVRKAIRDGGLDTRIVSIDPHPRAGIDALCDEVIREPFEDVSEAVFVDRLRANDIVFIDNSHRSFPNSDVTVFFTETLPLLPSGTYYGIHDIFLPLDYPPAWMDRFYNEQYLLVAYLLGGAAGDRIVFPGTHVVTSPQFVPAVRAIMQASGLEYAGANAGGFWMRRGPSKPGFRRSGEASAKPPGG
jgi:predicted O-methyltransferase YrrM